MKFKTTYLNHHTNAIKRVRRIANAFHDGHRLARECMVHVHCAGGCGAFASIRADKVKEGVIFVCNRRTTRGLCRAKLPRVVNGLVRVDHHQSAGAMTGLTWEKSSAPVVLGHMLADAAERAAVLMVKAFGSKTDKQV